MELRLNSSQADEVQEKNLRETRKTSAAITISPGQTDIEIPFPFDDPYIWDRLKYSVTSDAADIRIFAPIEGIVSLAYITDYAFELNAVIADNDINNQNWYDGRRFFFAEAVHPVTRKPVAGIEWDAELVFKDRNNKIEIGQKFKPAQVFMQEDGFADFIFDFPEIPEELKDELKDERYIVADVIITARRGDYIQESKEYIDIVGSDVSVRFQTDKPIYQPGQTINMRAVILDSLGRAAENEEAVLDIYVFSNESSRDEKKVYTSRLVSSPFGIIKDEWTIPEDAPTGIYRIVMDVRDRRATRHAVRVSRYELSAFSVTAKPDRAAYLPSERTKVTVTGTYLHGKPVPNGKVKITRFRWNSEKSENEEITVAEGTANKQGAFTATIDLREDHEDLAEDEYYKFADVFFSAYYQDEVSGRTEQRRFDIRVTRQPIHVYVYPKNYTYRGFPINTFDMEIGHLPAPIYVATSYADGNPASTSLKIALMDYDDRLKTINARTNDRGVAKVVLPGNIEDFDGTIKVEARDAAGRIGTLEVDLDLADDKDDHFRLETNRTLYRAGESVTVRVRVLSPKNVPPDATIVIHASEAVDRYVSRNYRKLASRVVHLKNYSGEVTFPWQEEFQRSITFVAWETIGNFSHNYLESLGAKTVIFPVDQSLSMPELKVQASLDRAEYKAGESAALSVWVNSADGHSVEAALGVAIVDQAVLERARTDVEFGRQSWFVCAYCLTSESIGELKIGGIGLSDLYARKPDAVATPEMDIIAEALVAQYFPYSEIDAYSFLDSFLSVPSSFIFPEPSRREYREKSRLGELDAILRNHYLATMEMPQNETDFARILGSAWTDLRDPWGQPYYFSNRPDRNSSTIEIRSAGPDKLKNTKDDFRAGYINEYYVNTIESAIRAAMTGKDYPESAEEFFDILRKAGLPVDAWRGGRENSLRVEIRTYGNNRQITVFHDGNDHKAGTSDDFIVASLSGPYFSEETRRISEALRKSDSTPENVEEFQKVLLDAGIDLSEISDAWGRPYKITQTFDTRQEQRFLYKTTVSAASIDGNPVEHLTRRIPVTVQRAVFSLRSDGPNPERTSDGFEIANFPVAITKEETPDISYRHTLPEAYYETIRICGIVVDQYGRVVPGAEVIAANTETGVETKAVGDDEGAFFISLIPDGVYSLRVTAVNARPVVITDIRIFENEPVHLTIELDAIQPPAAKNVEEFRMVLKPVDAEMGRGAGQVSVSMLEAGASTGTVIDPMAIVSDERVSGYTPYVRQYFPETLLWIPELITGEDGRATTEFQLADTITTWKAAVVASTKDGRIAETENDFRTFQPFFLEFNPPQTLTEGDEVTLPVTVRNYLKKSQKTEISVVPNDWSEILSGERQTITIPADGLANAAFTLRAKSSGERAAQQIIAKAGREGDAIEKTLSVHPDEKKSVYSYGDLASTPVSFTVSIPEAAAGKEISGQLRVYPDIKSLLFQSAAALFGQPYCCTEQIVSAGYANLHFLRYSRSAKGDTVQATKIEKLALDNVRKTVERLKGSRNSEGGFGYWNSSESNAAVTAYALVFLIEASRFTVVDPADIRSATAWIEKHQDEWMPPRDMATDDASENRLKRSVASLVARALSAAGRSREQVQSGTLGGAHNSLTEFIDLIDYADEPYALANFILAALDSRNEELVVNSVARLIALAREDRGGVYWEIQDRTPFNGWGKAGNIETTGLAVSALSAWRLRYPDSIGHEAAEKLDSLIRRGVVFLLRERRHDNYWRSTQAAMRAMQAVIDALNTLGGFGGQTGTLEITISGKPALTVAITENSAGYDPVTIDLSEFLTTGDNPITITPSAGMQTAMILFSSTYWSPWDQGLPGASSEVKLDVRCGQPDNPDTVEARVGEQISCYVKADRIGSRSRGMMIASIGLPPGAEADRASLEKLIYGGANGVHGYEVRPDRVVFYLWPTQNMVADFRFDLSARFPMNAKSEPSVLYDYYNPEAMAEIPPLRWIVK